MRWHNILPMKFADARPRVVVVVVFGIIVFIGVILLFTVTFILVIAIVRGGEGGARSTTRWHVLAPQRLDRRCRRIIF